MKNIDVECIQNNQTIITAYTTKWITFNQTNMRVLIVLITFTENIYIYQISCFHLHSSIKSLCTISVTFANSIYFKRIMRFTSVTQYGTYTHSHNMKVVSLFRHILQSHNRFVCDVYSTRTRTITLLYFSEHIFYSLHKSIVIDQNWET